MNGNLGPKTTVNFDFGKSNSQNKGKEHLVHALQNVAPFDPSSRQLGKRHFVANYKKPESAKDCYKAFSDPILEPIFSAKKSSKLHRWEKEMVKNPTAMTSSESYFGQDEWEEKKTRRSKSKKNPRI